ncbi:hemerythrin domain-containing protein [Parafrankia sp. BMG5.11]|uniref:hemerythrin domain-containing protein n=1 Tax=Parafrankia sp. BMG5.11 TaxID=222540 RepID=UPI001A9EB850|nr:hemerythrin domain-containing protein [Parafrankia sp. BMG5.11]
MADLDRDANPLMMLLAGGAGLMLGLLANPARKLAVQAPTMLKGEWDEALAAEHKATLAVFDLLEKTSSDDTARRSFHLMQIKHIIGKHAFQEENVVYATMRQRGLLEQAQHLNEDHGVVKQLLFDLTMMPKDDARWLETARTLRGNLETHMAEEENDHFPKLRAALSAQENAELAKAMNKEGLKLA